MLFKNRKSYILNFSLILALLGGLFGIVPARAITYAVINTNDSGAGSLRQAITDAASGDTIIFDSSLTDQTITLASDLVINKDLVIDGSGLSSQVTISGGNVAHLEVSIGKVVSIANVTITNGYTTGSGGAIYSSGNLTLLNVTLKNNHAVGGGGAIYGVWLTLKNSTIYQNQADSDGGAIFIGGNGISTIVNSTVRQNQSGGSGGGIAAAGNTYVDVFNSTFAGNSASGGSELFLIGNFALSLSNTILACIPENNSCIIQSGNGSLNSPNTIIATGTLADFGLAELADNGGPTQTMALLPGSPLIDAGEDATCANVPVNNLDQRNASRSQGSHCDIGAYESDGVIVPTSTPVPTNTPGPVMFTISGNAGVGGAVLSYVDGSQKSVIANSFGNYSFQVPEHWSGTVTPSKSGYIFSPISRTYSDVVAHQFSQNYAVTIVVTNLNDTGPGSLRQAIADAASGATIYFDPALAGQTITLASTINIQKSITIDGTGLNPRVEISGGNAVRIFLVDASSTITPAIRNVVLKEGKQTGLSYTYFGGALFVGGDTTLTIENVLITNNSAYTAGAIYISPYAVVTISNSEIIGNEAYQEAGAILVKSIGILNLRSSVIANNISGAAGAIYFTGATNSSIVENNLFADNSAMLGGAITGQLGNARIEIRKNLFTGNHATGVNQAGGAVYFSASTIPTLVILENNSFYNNVAAGIGGGAYLDAAADFYLINNTFSDNTATTGGNLYLSGGASVPRMYNNIIANNAGGGDCYAHYNSYIYGSKNLIEDGSPTCFPAITGDPMLGSLQDNGGATQTMALLPGSPAIDAGDNANCPAADQRGVIRPQGNGCEIGAYEYVPPTTSTPTNTPTISPTPVTSCNQITHGPLVMSGSSMSMTITNPLTIPIQIQDVFLVWNHDKGHMVGVDKTLQLNSVSLGSHFWNGTSSGPSITITPSTPTYIPTGTSTITFNFHQSYDNFDGTEELLISLATNGCQSYPIHSSSIATNTPTPTFTPTSTPTATPPYSYAPLYLSLSGNQTIGGVASADEDILKFDGSAWSLFFDGSDVGVGGSDLFGFSFLDEDSLLLSFTTSLTLNGISVTPQDVVRFDATSLGSVTSGTFSMYFDGSDVGFDTTAEKIDSVSLLPDGRLLLSTTGNPAVIGVIGAKDEDVLEFTPTTLGDTTSGNWAMYFDGSDVGLAETSGEDVDALDVTANGNIYLSTADSFTVNGVSGADEDVFVCVPTSVGEVTACTYSPLLYFDGSTWGLSANDVDAFHFLSTGPVPTNTPTNTPTLTPSPTFTPTGTNTPPTSRFVQIVQPNGGEVLVVGSTYRITWNSTSDIDTVTLGYKSCDSCLDWIATGIPNVGYYDWNVFVGNTINTQFKIFILGYDTGVGSWSDVSDNNFTVLRPTATPTITHTPTATLTSNPTNTSTPTIIPSITSTPGVPNLIFKDGFESGSLSAWTSSTIDLGDLSASAASALVGTQGMQAVLDDNNTIYVTDDSPNAEPTYRARFYFDPNSIPMLSGDTHFIFKGFMGTSTEVLRTEFRQSAGLYQLRISLLDDGTTWINSNWFTISDTSHFIEMDWHAGTGVGANNGSLTFWIDGILQANLTAVDNDTRRIDRVRLGALTGVDNGTRGTYYFDAFESSRQTYIGP